MKIVYLPSDMDAPGFYRCLSPGRLLHEHGHSVSMPPRTEHVNPETDKLNVEFTIDLPPAPADLWVLQQRKERMWVEGGVQKLREAGIAVIADVDDNYEELPEWNPAFYGTHPYRRDDGVIINRQVRRQYRKRGFHVDPNKHNRLHMNKMFEQCDAVTVSTPYLADLYRKFNPRVYVVRNYVDWDIWAHVQPQYEVERERLRIGYLGVFRYRQGDLDVIRDVIPKFLARHPEVDFVANTEEVHDFLGVPREQRITIGEYSFYPRDGGDYPVGRMTAVMDVGLVPMANHPLNYGKSHLKGMEYNAAGIPFICSPMPSYTDYWLKQANVSWKHPVGIVAHNEREWLTWLEEFATRDDWRRECGRWGRVQAKSHSIQSNWQAWETVFNDVLGNEYTALAREAIKRGAIQKVTELERLLYLAKGAETVVEIGSARGGTFWALCAVAADDATLVSIDIPAGSPIDMRGGKDVYGRRERGKFRDMSRAHQRVITIDGNSQEPETLLKLRSLLNGREVDLLLIDGDHRYEGVKRDYEMYSPLVRKGGLIAFHDIVKHKDTRVGVHRLWSELRRGGETREFIGQETWGFDTWGGIGVISR